MTFVEAVQERLAAGVRRWNARAAAPKLVDHPGGGQSARVSAVICAGLVVSRPPAIDADLEVAGCLPVGLTVDVFSVPSPKAHDDISWRRRSRGSCGWSCLPAARARARRRRPCRRRRCVPRYPAPGLPLLFFCIHALSSPFLVSSGSVRHQGRRAAPLRVGPSPLRHRPR
jgi:hypothetical protein